MIMNKIILITGGERSGKSSFAEQTALSLSTNPVYMATSRVWDDEFRERVRQHQLRRGPEWTNIEEELNLSRHDVKGRVVLIDCVTLWCTNFFYRDQKKAEKDLQDMLDKFIKKVDDATAAKEKELMAI